MLAYAVLLVPVEHPNTANRLVIFAGRPGLPYQERVVEQWDGGGAGTYFIRKLAIRQVFSTEWIRRLHVAATDGVLLVDSGTAEYGAEVYFWADHDYKHEPVDR
ncbi:MAG: hypothetical protein ABSH37_17005 [Bryobacteraceae bacterium]|jgi:hypothetical protein